MPQASTAEHVAEPILRRDDHAGISTLTLNRPAQYNALSEEMLSALIDALAAIGEDETINVVVLAAAGRAFCAGHDLKQMRQHDDRDYFRRLFEQCSEMMLSIVNLPQPVIARVHGTATAAGCQLVATCDLAVAAENARFAVSGITIGLFCSTPAVALGRNVSRKHAMEMLLTGDFVDARRAYEIGLVNRVVSEDLLDEEINSLALKIGGRPRESVALGKKGFYRQMETGLEDAYRLAAENMACNMMFGDTIEGVDAFIGKRKPAWAE